MLPKNKKIPRKIFPFILKKADVFKNNLFILKFTKGGKESRFCFSVSKKISKSAVIRNKIRRAGYRLLKKHISKIKPGALIIFSFIRLPKNEEEIDKSIESILREAKMM
jgi:ribonuclease P protein component